MSNALGETEDLAKIAVAGRAARGGRARRALIARLLSEQANGADEEGADDMTEEGDDDDRTLVRAIVGSRVLKRRRLRRLLMAHIIRERNEAGEGAEEDYEDADEDTDEEEGVDDRRLGKLLLASRMLRRRRVRRALLAHAIRAHQAEEGEETDDFEDEDEIEGGTSSERKFLRLVIGSRVLRRRRVRRVLLARLAKNRAESDDDFDTDDEDSEGGSDVDRSVARLLVAKRATRRSRVRRAALVRYLRNQQDED